eukprot:TRINITY_DN883_c0_g1_i6.p1 TRINITY_DN883_c0_g1~~TRINITY_DN883_c0_g1_i6.p1  ORF type:complete len:352 (+),score=24.72 TRINITY_DN883_c0_g1_i6:84-1058(+)
MANDTGPCGFKGCRNMSKMSYCENCLKSGQVSPLASINTSVWRFRSRFFYNNNEHSSTASPVHPSGWYPTTLNPNQSFDKNELLVLSYNVWFSYDDFDLRMQAIGHIIEQENPDIIALQEVTVDILQALLSQNWSHRYHVSDPYGHELGKPSDSFKYGNILLSKVPFQELYLRDFPGCQSRKALVGNVLFNNGKNTLSVGTFHLESYPTEYGTRSRQVELFQHLLKDSTHAILIGDSNMESEYEVGFFNAARWKDAYYDVPLKPSVPETYPSWKPSIRYDRMFYTYKTIKPIQLRHAGNEEIKNHPTKYPSDHVAIIYKIQLQV